MSEWRLFEPGTIPDWTTPHWYAGREAAPHLEQDGHRDRLLLTAEMVRVARSLGASSVVDLGAGDGGLLSLVGGVRWGYDLQQTNVDAAAARHEAVDLLDVVASWPRDAGPYGTADIVVATEFLEHLLDPHAMVRRIAATRARFLVASSPFTETDQAHYEFHTFAWDEVGYRALLEDNGWRVLRQERAWIAQVVLAERDR